MCIYLEYMYTCGATCDAQLFCFVFSRLKRLDYESVLPYDAGGPLGGPPGTPPVKAESSTEKTIGPGVPCGISLVDKNDSQSRLYRIYMCIYVYTYITLYIIYCLSPSS